MINFSKIRALFPTLIFVLVYTLLFFLFTKTFLYLFPFLLALIIACFARKPIAFCKKHFKMKNKLASALITGLMILIIFTLLIILIFFFIREAVSFLLWLSADNFAKPVEIYNLFAEKLNSLIGTNILENNVEKFVNSLMTGAALLSSALNVAMETVSSIPTLLTWLIVTVVASFVFSHHMADIRLFIAGFFSEKALKHLRFVLKATGTSTKKSFFSYAFLYFIAFCESLVVTTILGIDYPLIVSLIMCVADILPVLGPGLVYIPLAVYHLLLGHYGIAVGLVIGFILISVTREIIEPKLVADSIKVHPLSMIAAVYFSLLAKDIWVMFYFMWFFMLYSLFRESGALPPIYAKKESLPLAENKG